MPRSSRFSGPLLRWARNLPIWWHERHHRCRPAGGTRRPGLLPTGQLLSDLLARYGGEAFVLLLAACALDDAVQIVERPRVATPLVTCSVGLASWDFSEAAPELVERADRALYLAKAEGRNRFVTA
jgi:hypothetical protein